MEYGTDPLNAVSNPMAILANVVNFSDDNDSDGFSDELEAWYYTDPNHAASHPIDLDGDDIPDDFDSSNDTDAPKLLGFDIVENIVTVQTGEEVATFNLTVVDDSSGLESIGVYLKSSNGQSRSASLYSNDLGGNVHSLSIQSSPFGEFAESGIWEIDYIVMYDVAGNGRTYNASALTTLNFSSSVQVNNDNGDTQLPTLDSFNFSEPEVNISTGSETVTFNAEISDDLSGLSMFAVYLRSPSGQSVSASLYAGDLGGISHTVSMTSSNFSLSAEDGVWVINYIVMEDVAGNNVSLSANNVASLGFTTSIQINNP